MIESLIDCMRNKACVRKFGLFFSDLDEYSGNSKIDWELEDFFGDLDKQDDSLWRDNGWFDVFGGMRQAFTDFQVEAENKFTLFRNFGADALRGPNLYSLHIRILGSRHV